MAYRLHKFDDVLLPIYTPAPDMSTGQVESTLVDSVGGTFDYYGTRQRLPRRQVHQFSGVYIGESGLWVDHVGDQMVDHEHVSGDPNFLVDHVGDFLIDHVGDFLITLAPGNPLYFGSAFNDLRTQIDALTAKLGQRGQLWRQRLDDDVLQWKYARLLQVGHPRVQEDQHQAKITCTFETLQPVWRAATTTTTVASFAGSNAGLLVDIGGNATVNDATITVTAGGTPISSVVITGQGVDLRYTGTLAPGQSVVIDCGAQTVRIGDANDYSHFALGAGHTVEGWCPLAPGANVIVVHCDGSGSVSIQHYDQWL